MEMINLIYFILCSYGLTQIVMWGKIFDKIRPNTRFWICPMCVGFWVGIGLALVNKYTELFSFDYSTVTIFLLGCLSSGTTYFLSMLLDDFGIKINGEK